MDGAVKAKGVRGMRCSHPILTTSTKGVILVPGGQWSIFPRLMVGSQLFTAVAITIPDDLEYIVFLASNKIAPAYETGMELGLF
jgi:hypothetical protein